MADYSGNNNGGYPSKPGLGTILPAGQVDSGWGRFEPLITPEKLVRRHLMGLDLRSRTRNPLTGKYDVWTADDLQDEIQRAISNIETEYSLDIMPVQHAEKQEFIRQDYEQFGYMRTRHKPVQSVEEFAIVPANNIQVYEVPLDWIETAGLGWGQLNIVPLNVAVQNGGFIPSQSAGGAVFLSILAQNNIIPAYWRIVYTTGFPGGTLPRFVNELVGLQAAKQVIEKLLATYVTPTSHSLGVDGLSQSVGAPVIAALQQRLEGLQKDILAGGRRLKRLFGQGIIVGAV